MHDCVAQGGFHNCNSTGAYHVLGLQDRRGDIRHGIRNVEVEDRGSGVGCFEQRAIVNGIDDLPGVGKLHAAADAIAAEKQQSTGQHSSVAESSFARDNISEPTSFPGRIRFKATAAAAAIVKSPELTCHQTSQC